MGYIWELDSDSVTFRSKDGSYLICYFSRVSILNYSEPKDAIRDVPELAPIISQLSEEQKIAGTISLAFPFTESTPYLASRCPALGGQPAAHSSRDNGSHAVRLAREMAPSRLV